MSLPHLSRLILFAGLIIGVTLLDHLDLPLNCAINIHITTDMVSEERYNYCLQTISRLAKNIFQINTPRRLRLECSSGLLCIEDLTQADKRFEFRIFFVRDQRPTLYMTTTFLEEFTLPEFSQVTEFCFANFHVSRPSSTGFGIIHYMSFFGYSSKCP